MAICQSIHKSGLYGGVKRNKHDRDMHGETWHSSMLAHQSCFDLE